jgi:hypothetical protein
MITSFIIHELKWQASNGSWEQLPGVPVFRPGQADLSGQSFPQSISVELAQDLMSKAGFIDISVTDASGKPIVKRSLTISRTECKQKAEK